MRVDCETLGFGDDAAGLDYETEPTGSRNLQRRSVSLLSDFPGTSPLNEHVGYKKTVER